MYITISPFVVTYHGMVNNSKQPNFKGMHLDNYVKDLEILDAYSARVKKILPNKKDSFQGCIMKGIL